MNNNLSILIIFLLISFALWVLIKIMFKANIGRKYLTNEVKNFCDGILVGSYLGFSIKSKDWNQIILASIIVVLYLIFLIYRSSKSISMKVTDNSSNKL